MPGRRGAPAEALCDGTSAQTKAIKDGRAAAHPDNLAAPSPLGEGAWLLRSSLSGDGN
jgi:hypothetical protein